MILQLFHHIQQRVQSSRPLTFLATPSNKRYTSQRLLTNATAICPSSKILFFQPSQARPFRRAAVYAYRDVTPCWPRRRWAVQCARAIVRNMHGGTCENVGTSCTVREQWNDAFRTSSVPVFQSNQQRKKEGIQAVVSISASHEIRLFFFSIFL